MTIDELFALHSDLDVLALDSEAELAMRVRGWLRMDDVAKKRRLAVLQTRIAEVTDTPASVLQTAAAVYAHVESCAHRNEPRGLEAHEVGMEHWAIPGVPVYVPTMTSIPSSGAWMLRKLVPSVADALDAATEPAVAVQYKADERPGVGSALYTLLPLLDHSSAMLKALDGAAANPGRDQEVPGCKG
jgi:hypothetical protein